jgi:hypothetical protein
MRMLRIRPIILSAGSQRLIPEERAIGELKRDVRRAASRLRRRRAVTSTQTGPVSGRSRSWNPRPAPLCPYVPRLARPALERGATFFSSAGKPTRIPTARLSVAATRSAFAVSGPGLTDFLSRLALKT